VATFTQPQVEVLVLQEGHDVWVVLQGPNGNGRSVRAEGGGSRARVGRGTSQEQSSCCRLDSIASYDEITRVLCALCLRE
jgi:hypothetical protein